MGLNTSHYNLVDFLKAEPAIDKSPEKTEAEMVMELAYQLPNIPLTYLYINKGTKESC